MTEAQLKEAIAWLEPFELDIVLTPDHNKAVKVLLSLARSYLSAIKAGVPEFAIPSVGYIGEPPECVKIAIAKNEGARACLPLIVERDRKIAELERRLVKCEK